MSRKDRPKKRLFKPDIAEITERYQELGTLDAVGKYYGFCIETVRQFFMDNNIPFAKRRKFECDHNFFGRDNEQSFYWAGFIAADGNVEKGSNRIKVEIKLEDMAHLEKLKNDIQTEAKIAITSRIETRPQFKKETYPSCKLRISSDQLCIDLERFNIVPNKSKTYKIPEEIINHSLFNHFLRGLIEGDGWIYRNGQHSIIGLCGMGESTGQVFNFLKRKLDLIGGAIRISENGLYKIEFGKLIDTQKIINYLYKDCTVFLNRKQEVAFEVLLCRPVKITLDRQELINAINKYDIRQEIADHFDVSYQVVQRRMREEKLFMRSTLPANEP